MNERIEKLAEQAEKWVCENYPDALDDNDEFHAQTMKKFAELIVRECADRIRFCIKNDIDFIAEDVEKHFGVE